MTKAGSRECVCTNSGIHYCGWQIDAGHIDRSDGIATCTRYSIDNGSLYIKDMTIERIWELVSTNSNINCCGEQWQLSNSNSSDGIATCTRNSISNGSRYIKDMAVEGVWELIDRK